MTEFGDAIRRLREKRARTQEQLEKLDHAIAALQDLEREDASASTSAEQPTDYKVTFNDPVALADATRVLAIPGRRPQPNSVKTRVVELLLHNPNRTWAVGDIILEFQRSGSPPQAKDVGNAVRTALSEAAKDGTIKRVSPGVYTGVVPSPRHGEVATG